MDSITSIVVSEASSFATIAKPSAMTDAQLVEAIASHHQAAELAASTAVDRAMAAGDVLIEAKSRCRHGGWGGWLAENFSGSARTARSYMRLASHRDQLESKMADSAVLSIDSAVKALVQAAHESEPLTPVERDELASAEGVIERFLTNNQGIHECLSCIPEFSGDGFRGLVEDIKVNGQREPVVYWRGQLVDGRARIRACEILGREPNACELDDEADPWDYCWSANVLRASYSDDVRAAVIAKLNAEVSV